MKSSRDGFRVALFFVVTHLDVVDQCSGPHTKRASALIACDARVPLPHTQSMAARTLEKFGAHLRELREARDLSQTQLSDLAGLNRNYVDDVERGRRYPLLPLSSDLIQELFELFPVDPDGPYVGP